MGKGALLNAMEDNSNSFDTLAIVEELQKIDQGLVALNTSQKELTEYIILRDKKADKEKAAALEQEAEKKEAEEQEAETLEAEKSEQQTREADQQQTYTELLTDIRDQTVLTNNLISGHIFFTGMLFGVMLLSVLWNRFIR